MTSYIRFLLFTNYSHSARGVKVYASGIGSNINSRGHRVSPWGAPWSIVIMCNTSILVLCSVATPSSVNNCRGPN